MYHAPTTYRQHVRIDARGIRHVSLAPRRRQAVPDSIHLVAATLVMALALMISSSVLQTIRQTGIDRTLDELPWAQVVAGPEDSLWSLALSNAVPGVDTSDLVRCIRERNDLETSALALGQRLRVPVAYEVDMPKAAWDVPSAA